MKGFDVSANLAMHRENALKCKHRISLSYACPDCCRKGPQSPVAVPATAKVGVETRVAVELKPKKIRERRRRVMNRTERAYSEILELQRMAGEIVSWSFEGLALRWGNEESFTYSPDFVVVESVFESIADARPIIPPHVRLVFIEIKGGHIWSNSMTRFRHARDNFPLYEFRMIQKTKAGWEQIR